jgi:hypothetical protein
MIQLALFPDLHTPASKPRIRPLLFNKPQPMKDPSILPIQIELLTLHKKGNERHLPLQKILMVVAVELRMG